LFIFIIEGVFIKMKTKIALPILFAALIGALFLSCPDGGSSSGPQRVKVTFQIGYDGGVSPEPVTINKGESCGLSWPRDPLRSGYKFLGWFNSANELFDRDTVINGNVTLTAKWEAWLPGAEQPSKAEIAALFDTANGFPAQLSDAKKIWGMNNPLMTFAFVADPSPMVYCPKLKNSGDTEKHWCDECTLYVYGSNDTLAFNGNTPISGDFAPVIQGLRVVSTKDLVNWTDHGPINLTAKTSTNPLFDSAAEKVAPYASETWAPSAQWRMEDGKPKFFLYWCNSGNNTSVVVSDVSPVGPFYNPGLTESMVNKTMDGFETVSWLFDPGTMIDSNGKAYMVLGGDGSTVKPGNVRRVQMNPDMTSIVGNGPELNLPWHFEATDIWKWQGIYYINYTTNWSSTGGFSNIDIAYVMGDGPFADFPTTVNTSSTPSPEKANKLLPYDNYGESSGPTNHASLFDFKGKPYLIYHTSAACRAFGATRLRTAHLVDITVNDDGTLKPVTMGVTGVAQVLDSKDGGFNPYIAVEAETMAIEGGVYTKGKRNETASNGISVASIDTGDWLGLYGVDFDKKDGGATKFNAIVKLPVTAAGEDLYVGAIEIRIDPVQQGINNPTNASRLTTSANAQSRITGGEVVGRIQIKANDKADEDKWVWVSANLDKTVTGKHNLAFVFYSSKGMFKTNSVEKYNTALTPTNDGRTKDDGFEIDQWWFE
jgi:uncharacterized repeat protein (TIGR02543 family)